MLLHPNVLPCYADTGLVCRCTDEPGHGLTSTTQMPHPAAHPPSTALFGGAYLSQCVERNFSYPRVHSASLMTPFVFLFASGCKRLQVQAEPRPTTSQATEQQRRMPRCRAKRRHQPFVCADMRFFCVAITSPDFERAPRRDCPQCPDLSRTARAPLG